jgi:phage shock protein B
MVSLLPTSTFILASAKDSVFDGIAGIVALSIPIIAILCAMSPRLLRELREWRRPQGLRKEDAATLRRISLMLDKMESRVAALEVILGDSNAQKNNQPGKTQAYGNQR